MTILFRADLHPPGEIFKIGFEPKKEGEIQIQPGGQMIGGVSTSTDICVAMNYASCYSDWVYSLWADGINVLTFLTKQAIANAKPGHNSIGDLDNALTQSEVACDAIPNTAIIAARMSRKIGDKDEFFGLTSVNFACTLNEDIISLGMGPLAQNQTHRVDMS